MPDFRPIRIPPRCAMPDWPCQPIIAGAWREVPRPIVSALRSQSARCEGLGARPLPDPIERMRALRLSFYPGWLLLEALSQYSSDASGVFRLLLGPAGYEILDGQSPIIHQINGSHLVLAGKSTTIDQYVRFFAGVIRGQAGPFRIVEDSADLEPSQSVAASARGRVAELIKPMTRHRSKRKTFVREATVLYGRNLFRATFRVARSGMVEMVDDDPLFENFVAEPPSYDGIWQVFPSRQSPVPRNTR